MYSSWNQISPTLSCTNKMHIFYKFNPMSFEFTVPPMLSIPNQLEAAYQGQDVTLECQTEAYPASINYWTTEKGDMIISGKYDLFNFLVLVSFFLLVFWFNLSTVWSLTFEFNVNCNLDCNIVTSSILAVFDPKLLLEIDSTFVLCQSIKLNLMAMNS